MLKTQDLSCRSGITFCRAQMHRLRYKGVRNKHSHEITLVPVAACINKYIAFTCLEQFCILLPLRRKAGRVMALVFRQSYRLRRLLQCSGAD